MMKLACPKCHLNLRVPDQKVPESGAWAQCPRCQERFFINPAGTSIDELTRPFNKDQVPAPGAGSRARDTSSQRMLDRLKTKRGQPGELDYQPGLIIVYPEPAIPDYVYQAASALMLGLPVLAVFLLFSFSSKRLDQADALRPEPVTTAVERLNDDSSQDLIRQDLLTIKRSHLLLNYNLYWVEHSGPESRVFKYFMDRLAPGVCSGISSLRVAVPPNRSSFSATGFCLEPEGRELKMRVSWEGASGQITFPYNKRTETIALYGSSGSSNRPPQPAGGAPRGPAAGAANMD